LRYAAAAAVALLFGVFYFFPSNRYSGSDKGSNLAPSSNNKTTLSLQDGKQVILDELKEGINEIEAGVFVTKSQGRIVYGSNTLNSTIHTLSTPVGATYQLVLPDQTTVWLNAESSLSFPVTFSREERLVKFSGEGYFEVSHTDPLADTPGKRPFKVETATTTVEVLGTEFNLSAYPNEPSATTLIEGKVKVQGSRSSVTLRPGQQAIASDKLNVAEVDTEELLAWREGFFQFDNRPLAFILPQLQRWYGFELAPNTTLPTKHFTASISRSQSLPTVLKMLEISGDVKFSLTNNYLSVNQLNNN
jgi:transmembrane sensor